MTFEQVVAAWLDTVVGPVTQVTEVVAYGTDWAGDTEHGFVCESEVRIKYEQGGKELSFTVEGENMQSLWEFVVGAWPHG